MSEIRLSSILGPVFHEMARDVFRHGHTHYDPSGGCGSLKSSCVSLLVPLILRCNPGTHALVLRKVANTIRDSVFAQYIWAVDRLGMAAHWDTKVQRIELIYRPTGQKIMFRGADVNVFENLKLRENLLTNEATRHAAPGSAATQTHISLATVRNQ